MWMYCRMHAVVCVSCRVCMISHACISRACARGSPSSEHVASIRPSAAVSIIVIVFVWPMNSSIKMAPPAPIAHLLTMPSWAVVSSRRADETYAMHRMSAVWMSGQRWRREPVRESHTSTSRSEATKRLFAHETSMLVG